MKPNNEFGCAELIPEFACRKSLGECGREVKLYRGCRIINPQKLSIGDYSQIDETVFINAGAGVTIGRYVHLAIGSSISGGGKCVIEDFAGIGAGVRIITGTELVGGGGLTNPTVPARLRHVSRQQVVICAHALVFTNALVLPGVHIGEGAVVSAGSIVHRNLKPWRIYGGNPVVEIGVRPKDLILKRAAQLLRRGAGKFR